MKYIRIFIICSVTAFKRVPSFSDQYLVATRCLILTSLLSLFFIGKAEAQTADHAKPYWEYIRTESGVFPYKTDGCYQPSVHKAEECFVDITVTKCFHPNDKKPVKTRLKFEWLKPPQIIPVGTPISHKLTTTLIENSDPEWVISGGVYLRDEMQRADGPYIDGPYPGSGGGASADFYKGSPNPVILAFQKNYVGGWDKSSILRITIVASHSNQHWWSYIYRYVVPLQKDGNEGVNYINRIWKVVEKDLGNDQYWEATWKLKDDGRSFDGYWKHFPGGQEGDLPNFARILSISNDQIIIDRPGYGTYRGTISADRKKINGTLNWCPSCTWSVLLETPLPKKIQ